jgi:hypothetical protein
MQGTFLDCRGKQLKGIVFELTVFEILEYETVVLKDYDGFVHSSAHLPEKKVTVPNSDLRFGKRCS